MKFIAMFMIVTVAAVMASSPNPTAPLRTVHGTVVDRNGKTVSGSIVYLHDQTTDAVTTRITDHFGHYRFSGISYRTDYRVHAEHADMASRVHLLSVHSAKRTMSLELKLNKKKVAQMDPAQDKQRHGPILQEVVAGRSIAQFSASSPTLLAK